VRLEDCRRQAHLIIANFMVAAAVKLVELVGCDKETVARQACLDILEMKPLAAKEKDDSGPGQDVRATTQISDEQAAEVLRTLANNDNKL